MSDDGLSVEVRRRIREGLILRVAMTCGAECAVLFGPSGAGKSSLLRMIAGLDRPDAGVVRVGGRVLFDSASRVDVPLRRRRIGMIFQEDRLFPHRNVARNIAFGLAGAGSEAIRVRMAEVAALCGVTHLLDREPATLSGGERQRVALARALAPRPSLLLCDEPVSALDVDARFALLSRLKAVQAAERIPIVYVTHSPAEAVALGSTLFFVAAGRIVDHGEPLDVLARRSGGVGLLDGLRNVFRATVARHEPDGGATVLRLDGGPELRVPYNNRPVGSAVVVSVPSEDVLLVRGAIEGMSARNVLAGNVERVITHGGESEVLVLTGDARWIAGIVSASAAALGLEPAGDVLVVVKARSCRLADAPESGV